MTTLMFVARNLADDVSLGCCSTEHQDLNFKSMAIATRTFGRTLQNANGLAGCAFNQSGKVQAVDHISPQCEIAKGEVSPIGSVKLIGAPCQQIISQFPMGSEVV